MSEEKKTLVSFDWAIKSILRDKQNFDILEGFLTDLLSEDIKITGLLDTESNKKNKDDKLNRVDLKAEDSKKREIIIEVQYASEPDYLERVYFGACKALVDGMQEKFRYGKVKKIISVSLVYFDLLKEKESYIIKGETIFKDYHSGRENTQMKKDNIFAEYYLIQPKRFNDDVKNKLDEWVYMFKHSEIKGDVKATNMDVAEDKLAYSKMSREEQQVYEDFKLNQVINEGVLQVKMDEGLAAGMEKGLAQGLEQGLVQGLEKGLAQGEFQKAAETAKEMISENEPIEKIIKYTKLTEEQIQEIKNSI